MTGTKTMRATASLAFVSALLLLVTTWMLASTAPAYACSIGSFGSPEGQRNAMIESLAGSDLVIIGTVLDERHVGKVGNNETYESNVAIEAVLAGDITPSTIVVGHLSYYDSLCSGGPRLYKGEQVLVALDQGFIETDGKAEDESIWRLHRFLGKVLLDGGEAVSQYASLSVSVGEPEALIRQYGEALGSDETQIEQAVAAAEKPAPVSRSGWLESRAPFIAALVAAIVVSMALYLRASHSWR